MKQNFVDKLLNLFKTKGEPISSPGCGEHSPIEFMGNGEITQNCINSITELIQGKNKISKAFILTNDNSHCFYLEVEPNLWATPRKIFVKSGFSSGYSGEGPSGFSYILLLLDKHGVPIDEYSVDIETIVKINRNELTWLELKALLNSKPIRPERYWSYIDRHKRTSQSQMDYWKYFPLEVPFKIIEQEILDLALNFWNSPSDTLLQGYRRLEDSVRKKSGLKEHGTKLFRRAFMEESSVLLWNDIESEEQKVRAQLFIGLYGGYRNPRAHREIKENQKELLSEFLILNHLFRLVRKSTHRKST